MESEGWCVCGILFVEVMLMQAWEAIQRTVDYMEEHYEEELTIEQLSAIAHLSKFYYQRLFYRDRKSVV